jgi:large subunit ribosomal protein L30
MSAPVANAKNTQTGAVAVIRLRGVQNINPKTKDTLRYLRLTRVNHAVVLPKNETTLGMLQVAKDFVTWGDLDAGTLASVIQSRGRIVGDKPLTESHLAKHTPHKTFAALADAIVAGKIRYSAIPDIKPIFRLHPARAGLEGIKRSVQNGGALGYRGRDINELLGRMLGVGPHGTGDVAATPAAKPGGAA